MKLGKKDAFGKRILALALSASMVFAMAGCGKASGGQTETKEWLWVPEYVNIESEDFSYYDLQLVGDSLCYLSYDWDQETEESSQSMRRFSLTDQTETRVPLTLSSKDLNLNRGTFAQDGSMYALGYVYNEEDGSRGGTFLCKFDSEGNQVFGEDMTELVQDSYVDSVAVDGEGRIYVSGDATVWLFNAEGKNQGSVSLDSAGNGWIRSMGSGKDGKMYVSYSGSDQQMLADIDFEGKKLGNTYENFPDGNGQGGLVKGIDKDFLIQDGNKVYEYDLKKQAKEELFTWLDSDINGSAVQSFGVMEDGRILAVISDWDSQEKAVAMLTKKKASEVPQKETIVIGSLYGGSDIQSAAVRFNKSNEKYRISLRSYFDYSGWDGDDYQAYMADCINRMNNDITSSNCPDILDLSGLNMKQLAAKGVFEDLGAYLDKSEKLDRSHFLENIIEAYTIDGTLVSIPYSFQMQTVVAKGAEVGDERGWTIDEMIAFADAHPEAVLFDNTPKASIMMYLMMYNADAFIDWSTGECRFDTDEFKSILNFVNRFPDEINWQDTTDDASTPNKIQRGDVLLYEANLYNFEEIQVCNEIFKGDASYIGYPTMDGSEGCMLSPSQAYAITAKSGKKDGAWEFIEQFLTREVDMERSLFGFPTSKSMLNTMAEDAVKVEYYTDENGDPVLDENGEAIVMGGGGGFSYSDGWSYEYRKPTQEEVDVTLSLMESAKPVSYSQGDQVLNIINEEAAAFYKGQKTVDEVASVIQSRIKVYVGENR
ncbi:MAG: extracellular solute-binding protein [Lachnospiraceae bacterium]|nr:extracellular solute-binding protein [Lachnospiraceae bacterium]